jgi:hypothetical protein
VSASRSVVFLRHLVVTLTALSALALGAVGGRAYLWCAPMGEARLHCCCPAPDEDLEDAPLVSRACCEPRTVGELLDATDARIAALDLVGAPPPSLPRIVGAPLLEPELDARLAPQPPRRARHPARAGPGRRLHAQVSVYLL